MGPVILATQCISAQNWVSSLELPKECASQICAIDIAVLCP